MLNCGWESLSPVVTSQSNTSRTKPLGLLLGRIGVAVAHLFRQQIIDKMVEQESVGRFSRILRRVQAPRRLPMAFQVQTVCR